MPINISAKPDFYIVLYFSQQLLLSKPLYSLYLCARMSSKSSKVLKNKHGVKVMGLTKDSSATSSHPVSNALVEHQETLDVQPLLHEPPLSVQPDFPKNVFKTKSRYSSRLRNSKKGKRSTPSTAPIEIPDDDVVNVAEVITEVVDSILEETAAKVMEKDVVPDAATSGDSEIPNTTNPVDPSICTPTVNHPASDEEASESEEEDSGTGESEKEEEETGDVGDQSKKEDVTKTADQEPVKSSSDTSESEDSEEEEEDVQVPSPEIISSEEESDDVPITKNLPGSVAARLKMKERA